MDRAIGRTPRFVVPGVGGKRIGISLIPRVLDSLESRCPFRELQLRVTLCRLFLPSVHKPLNRGRKEPLALQDSR